MSRGYLCGGDVSWDASGLGCQGMSKSMWGAQCSYNAMVCDSKAEGISVSFMLKNQWFTRFVLARQKVFKVFERAMFIRER